MYFLTAITIGIMGSLHCVGMCGPIAMAIPLHNNSKAYRYVNTIVYLIGKAITYSFLGIFAGTISQTIVFSGLQQYISIISGALILLVAVLSLTHTSILNTEKLSYKWVARLKTKFQYFISKKNTMASFGIGLLNGLLPCGLVYLALAGAVGAGGVWQGAAYMFLFGLGTAPLLAATMVLKRKFSLANYKLANKLIPIFSITLAVLLIVRGLNLGIPYLSPKIEKKAERTVIECCTKP